MFFLSRLTSQVRALRTPPGDALEHNVRLLYYEIAFAAVLSGVAAFNATFAIRLGATKETVALLSSIPALIVAVLSVPSARFMQRRLNRKRWLFGICLFANRLGYVVVAIVPLFLERAQAANAIVGLIILLSVPGIFFTNGFQALLGELIPEQRRARVFSVRQVCFSVIVIVTTLLAGKWLDSVAFPHNFQLLYLFGFAAVLGSQFYLYRLDIPSKMARPMQPGTRSVEHSKPVQLKGPVGRLLFNLAVYQFGLFFAMPLFAVYYIDNLKATDGWIGLNTAAGSIGVIFGYIIWERLLRRRDFGWSIRRASLLTWTYPVLIGLFPDLTFLLLVNLFVNAIHPGVDLSSLNLMYRLSPEENRTMYMSWFNMILNGSMFVAPLVGVWVADQWGLLAAFMISGLFRFIGGILFNVNTGAKPGNKLSTTS